MINLNPLDGQEAHGIPHMCITRHCINSSDRAPSDKEAYFHVVMPPLCGKWIHRKLDITSDCTNIHLRALHIGGKPFCK